MPYALWLSQWYSAPAFKRLTYERGLHLDETRTVEWPVKETA